MTGAEVHRAANSRMTATTRHGVLLMIAAVMPAMAIISLVPVLPLLMTEFAHVPGADFLVPMALTIPALCVALFAPLAGWLADRFGRKRLLVLSLVVYSLVGLLPIWLADLSTIIASRVVLGIAEAAIMTVATTLIGDYFEGERRERWIATQVAVVSVSAIFLIAAGGLLGELFGSRGPFLLYMAALPLALLVAAILFEPLSQEASDSTGAFPYGRILPMILITFGAGILFYTVLVKLGPILALAGVASPGLVGAVGAAANLGVLIGTVTFKLLGRLNRFTSLAIGFALAAIGYIGLVATTSFGGMAVSAVVACVGGGVLLPTLVSWTLRLLPAEIRGRGMGMWTGTFFLAQFAAPLLSTALSHATGTLRGSLLVLGLFAVLAAVAAGWNALASRKEHKWS